MNTHLSRAYTFLHGALTFTLKGLYEVYRAALSRKRTTLLIIALIGVGGVVTSFLLPGEAEVPFDDRREVEVSRVSDLTGSEPLTLIGTVKSTSEANVAANTAGSVTRVYRSLGDFVVAGSVIAEIKNDRERAALAQARATLDKVKNSTSASQIGLSSTKDSFEAAQSSARASINTAYATLDDAVRRKTDGMFSNPSSPVPKLIVSTSNSQLALTAEKGRVEVQPLLARQSAVGEAPTEYADILAELSTLSTETAKVRSYLQDLVAALNAGIASGSVTEAAIAGYRADANIALSSVNGLASSLATTIDVLKTRKAGVDATAQNLATGDSGVTADVAAAEAAVQAAQAQLEQTIIRAPISGTINKLNLEVGSFASPGVPVIYITNPRGLEVVAFVSARDIRDIVVGSKAVIAGTVQGTVVRVASALDPVTKKAEVKIGIPADAALVSGQSATVAITRATKTAALGGVVSIPLAALKITPEGPVVFTVSESSTLVSHPVVLGTLRGASVDIDEGITGNMEIVTDARGLKEGDVVVIK